MPTTSNFGWTTPADTDLVKDGAAAIRTLGNGIDTSLVDLKGGTTGQVLSKASNTDLDFTWSSVDPLTILDAKGDLISATAADTPARLASSGVNGNVLTVDTSTATGLKWAAPVSGSMTLLSTTTWSSVNKITISSISQAYKHLYIELEAISPSQADPILFAPNDNTSNNMAGFIDASIGTASTNISNANISATSTDNFFAITIFNYASTARKTFQVNGGFVDGGANNRVVFYSGLIRQSSVTSLAFYWSQTATLWDAGTIRVYGVN